MESEHCTSNTCGNELIRVDADGKSADVGISSVEFDACKRFQQDETHAEESCSPFGIVGSPNTLAQLDKKCLA